MSDEGAGTEKSGQPNQDGKDSGATSAADDGFTPITSQDDLNKAIAERLARERAKFSDYKELKAKADELAAIKEAQKSDAEKAAERLAAAEKDAANARREALRFKVAAKFSITDEDADLFLTGNDEETLTRQAERLAARAAEAGKPRAPKPDPNQGRAASTGASTAEQFAAAFNEAFNR